MFGMYLKCVQFFCEMLSYLMLLSSNYIFEAKRTTYNTLSDRRWLEEVFCLSEYELERLSSTYDFLFL